MPTTNINLGFVAAAAGTVDIITAAYTPAFSALADKMLVWFRASGANTSTTPTFNPDGLGAKTIVKNGGQALVAGDIPATGAIVGVVYNLANTWWEIIGYFEQSGWVDNGTSVVLKTITDNVGIGTATPFSKLQVTNNVPASFVIRGDYVVGDFAGEINFGNVVNGFISTITDNNNGIQTNIQQSADRVSLQAVFNALASDITITIDSTGIYATGNNFSDEAFFVSSLNGNVGINNNSPQEKLHVTGNVRLENETASRIAIFDASKNIKSGDTATYPSLTELAFLKGVTSPLNTKPEFSGITMSDETTVLGAASTSVPLATMHFPYAFTITQVYAGQRTAGTGASPCIVDIHLNGTSIMTTTKIVFTNGTKLSANGTLTTTAVVAGDYLEFFLDQRDTNNVATGLKCYVVGHQ